MDVVLIIEDHSVEEILVFIATDKSQITRAVKSMEKNTMSQDTVQTRRAIPLKISF